MSTYANQPALSVEETLAWVEKTWAMWQKLLAQHPEALSFACDIYKTSETAGGLLQHIAAVELRYAQRLAGEAESPYEAIPRDDFAGIVAAHASAMAKVREVLGRADYDWSQELEFDTLTLGRIAAPRKAIVFHLLLHTVRHFGQLATLMRQHGIKTGFPMDYLMMQARRA